MCVHAACHFLSGDIQIGMVYRKERLDVEVIRARGLVGKQGTKNNVPGTPLKGCISDARPKHK